MATVIVKPRVCTTLGTISAVSTSATGLTFGCNDLSYSQGRLSIVVTTGAVTTPTFVLEASVDNGITYFVLSTYTSYAVTGNIGTDTPPIFASTYDISGLPGALFKFGLTVGTGITAMTVIALAG